MQLLGGCTCGDRLQPFLYLKIAKNIRKERKGYDGKIRTGTLGTC
jgi:hypothetical protein